MNSKYVVAIDGPAASGKSTTAKLLAKKLCYVYIDTGAMYRACALRSLNEKIPLEESDVLKSMLDNIDIKIKYKDDGNRIFLQNVDVTERIRNEDISKLSSQIAQLPSVRKKMVDLQRKLGNDGGVILDGRDIGTVVFPNADFKFFMIADVNKRAKRRWEEQKLKSPEISYLEVLDELRWRDKNDSERKESPLKAAKDSIAIDTSDMTIEEQVEFIEKIIEK